MAILKWLPDAPDDLKRLHAFIEPHSLQAATRAVNTLIEAADTLAEFLHKGRASVSKIFSMLGPVTNVSAISGGSLFFSSSQKASVLSCTLI
jgi:plasmid stabilization system protein ParE